MSCMQVAVLCDEATSLLMPLVEQIKKRKLLKDEKKNHGAVDESSSEQQFHKSDMITFVV